MKPGQPLDDKLTSLNIDGRFRAGPGIQMGSKRGTVSATLMGELKKRGKHTVVVQCDQILYLPTEGDQVVGIIDDRGAGDYYKVNIGAKRTVLMSKLAFDGATKRNRPDLQKGDVIFCRVTEVNRHMDPVLSCKVIESSSVRRDWSSGEAMYGELRGGITVRVSTAVARGLLHPKSHVLCALGTHVKDGFEVAVGMNGVVWVRATNVVDTVVIRNALMHCRGLSGSDASAMVAALVTRGQEKKRELKNRM